MPSDKHPVSTRDDGDGDESESGCHSSTDSAIALEQALNEVEAEAAEAEAVAAVARARAKAIRRSLQPAPAASPGASATSPGAGADSRQRRRPRLRHPRWTTLVAGLVLLATGTAVAVNAYLFTQHDRVVERDRSAAKFAAAARQIVVTLMSIDASNVNQNVQQIIGNSTGPFKSEFESTAADFVKAAQDSKLATQTRVQAAGVESMTGGSAIVLVTATSTLTTPGGNPPQPRTWRLVVSLVTEAGQIKMSKLEFA